MTTEQRLRDARLFLASKIPFLGHLALNLVFIEASERDNEASERDNISTAGVTPEGKLYYNEDFVSELKESQLRGLIAHEVLHPALFFWRRLGGREHRLFNMAHDYAINQILADFFSDYPSQIELPPGALLSPRFKGLSAESIYDSLLSKRTDIVFMEDARSDLSARKGSSEQSKTEREWSLRVISAAEEHRRVNKNKDFGKKDLPQGIEILLKEILEPKIEWASLLSGYIGENTGQPEPTYLRPSRRSEAVGEILPGNKKKEFPDVTVIWDSSGSMSGEEKWIFSEVSSICDDLGLSIRCIIIDSEIHADLEDVEGATEIAESYSGGGGSDFSPAFKRLEEESNRSVVIAFTDGYIRVPSDMPESLKGCVWVLTDNGVDPTKGRWGNVLKRNQEFGSWA